MVQIPVTQVVRQVIPETSSCEVIEVTLVNARTRQVVLKYHMTQDRDLIFIASSPGCYLILLNHPESTVDWEYFTTGGE